MGTPLALRFFFFSSFFSSLSEAPAPADVAAAAVTVEAASASAVAGPAAAMEEMEVELELEEVVAVAAVGPGIRGPGLGSPLVLHFFFSSSFFSLLEAPAVLVSLFVVTLAAMQVSIIDASTLSMKVRMQVMMLARLRSKGC